MSSDVIVGMGEIGTPLSKILGVDACLDLKPELCRGEIPSAVNLLHICIPYFDSSFEDAVVQYALAYLPKAVVIHSTVKPHTTERIQSRLPMPVIFSPSTGVHRSMEQDMMHYTKYYAPENGLVKACYDGAGIKSKAASSPLLLEYRKILVDTTYYGWLIAYAQITNEICRSEGIDYQEMWEQADEIHAKHGNRPRMFPGVIGGHCVIPNAHLLDDKRLRWIIEQNDHYQKWKESE